MSSPNINNVLLLGCILCYTTVFFKPIGVKSAAICQIRVCCFCLGFTVSFGAMFSKTWRVYRIFTNKKAVRRIYNIGNDEEVRPYVRICYSSYYAYFGWIIYIMEGSLLAFGAFLAWETRKVNIPALNDSHQIGMLLYNVVILSAVGLTLSLLLEDQQVLLYGVTSGCLVIGTTLTQMIVFVPKVSALYQRVDVHETDNRISKAGPSSSVSSRPKLTCNTASTSVLQSNISENKIAD